MARTQTPDYDEALHDLAALWQRIVGDDRFTVHRATVCARRFLGEAAARDLPAPDAWYLHRPTCSVDLRWHLPQGTAAMHVLPGWHGSSVIAGRYQRTVDDLADACDWLDWQTRGVWHLGFIDTRTPAGEPALAGR